MIRLLFLLLFFLPAPSWAGWYGGYYTPVCGGSFYKQSAGGQQIAFCNVPWTLATVSSLVASDNVIDCNASVSIWNPVLVSGRTRLQFGCNWIQRPISSTAMPSFIAVTANSAVSQPSVTCPVVGGTCYHLLTATSHQWMAVSIGAERPDLFGLGVPGCPDGQICVEESEVLAVESKLDTIIEIASGMPPSHMALYYGVLVVCLGIGWFCGQQR